MRVLTIRQPWASLIALGVKTIETRSWDTKYRGPVAIHAGLRKADVTEAGMGPWRPLLAPGSECRLAATLPLGAIVAVADLTDSLPIIGRDDPTPGKIDGAWRTFIDLPGPGCLRRWYWEDEDPTIIDPTAHVLLGRDMSDELPYGDFTPGRFGWLLADVRPLPKPIPWKGGLGLRHAPPELVARLTEAVGS